MEESGKRTSSSFLERLIEKIFSLIGYKTTFMDDIELQVEKESSGGCSSDRLSSISPVSPATCDQSVKGTDVQDIEKG